MAMKQEITALSQADYEAIESAVMETGRGRWFLAEFARRNRTADTNMLLEAIARLEQSIGGEKATMVAERVRQDLMDMAKIIAQLKIELASDDPEVNRFEQATEALDAVVRTTESATSNILEAAEEIQEIAWTLREAGADAAACDTLDQRAADIYTACSFQDLTAQRTKKVVLTLRSIEGRINGLVDAWSTGETGEAKSPTATGGDPARPVRLSRYAPVPISRHQLDMDDIDLVMRDDHDALEVIDEYPPELPILGPVEPIPPEPVAPASGIDPSDIVMVERSATESESASPTKNTPGVEPAAPEGKGAGVPAPSLAEIDAWPAARKIELFS
jgi:chemotaxis regulatin CheY-phosphate phosphatase CheZ